MGGRWHRSGICARTLFTTVSTGEISVGSKTTSGIESIAKQADLRPMHGGRLMLRPFPTVTPKRLAVLRNGFRIVPWPRVHADLRPVGMRGEEAAEHLRKMVFGR